MTENFVKEGMWSTSIDFENPIFGKLIYSKEEGITLELKGVFNFNAISKIKYINLFGKTDLLNSNITLLECQPLRWGNSYIDFEVKGCYVGHHIENPEDLKIKNAKFEYFGLQDYIGNSGFNTDKNDNYEFSVNYNRPTSLKVTIEDLELEIFHSYSQYFQTDRGRSGELEIKMKEYITVIYNYQNKVNINRCLEDSECLSFFMATLSNNVIYAKNIEVTLEDGKNVAYYYKNPYFRNKYDNDDINFIPFNQFDLTEVLQKWFSLKDRYKTFANYKRVADLYHYQYDENRFLDSLAVLETFYREFRDNKMDKRYADTVQNVLSAGIIPENQIDFFKNRLQGGKSNYKKYCDLYYSLPINCRHKISERLNKYCRLLTNSRNAYTHNDRKDRQILKYFDMVNSTENNELLIKFLLLKEVGLDTYIMWNQLEREFNQVSIKEIEDTNLLSATVN